MSRILGTLPALLLAACFDPSFNNPTCGPAGECPDGYDCMAGVCRLPVTIEPDADPNAPDADPNAPDATPQPIDAMPAPDAIPACSLWTFNPGNVPCEPPLGSFAVSASATYDTGTGTLSVGTAPTSSLRPQDDGGMARVVSVDAFSVASGITLKIDGTYPLIVLVHGTATVSGTIDLSSALGVPAAGADYLCPLTAFGANGFNGVNDGGGGGGALGGSGEAGGDGDATQNGVGGVAVGALLRPIGGGCHGGDGGSASTAFGYGGAGGGAIQISARDGVTVAATGTIDAGGGGGSGGRPDGGGGGGGGSGGALSFEAPSIEVLGSLCANGGGGGEGVSTAGGDNGDDARCSPVAAGGSGLSANGGDGGIGSYTTGNPGPGINALGGGGGGGGGGKGVIRIRGTRTGTAVIVTPPATVVPL